MQRRTRLLFAIAPAIAIVGCTHKDGFALTQSIGASKQKCEERLTFADQTRCAAPYQVRFDDYQRERTAPLARRPEAD